MYFYEKLKEKKLKIKSLISLFCLIKVERKPKTRMAGMGGGYKFHNIPVYILPIPIPVPESIS